MSSTIASNASSNLNQAEQESFSNNITKDLSSDGKKTLRNNISAVGKELLDSQAVTNAPTVTFDISAYDYDYYVFECNDLTTNNSATVLYMRTSSDGITFDNGTTDYTNSFETDYDLDNFAVSICRFSTALLFVPKFSFKLEDAQDASRYTIASGTSISNSANAASGGELTRQIGGYRKEAAEVMAIQLLVTANLFSGTFKMFGCYYD